jgi:hypothetical protein
MNVELYRSFVLDCVSRDDVDCLTSLWREASLTDKENQKYKTIIMESIPREYPSFKEYVEAVDERRFTSLSQNKDATTLLKEFVRNEDVKNVKLCVSRLEPNLNVGLCESAKTGNLKLVKYFIELGAIDRVGALYQAARASQRTVVNYLLEIGVPDVSYGMQGAAEGGDGALWELLYSEFSRRLEKEEFSLSKMTAKEECLERCFQKAVAKNNGDLVKLLQEKGAGTPSTSFSYTRHGVFEKNAEKEYEEFT